MSEKPPIEFPNKRKRDIEELELELVRLRARTEEIRAYLGEDSILAPLATDRGPEGDRLFEEYQTLAEQMESVEAELDLLKRV